MRTASVRVEALSQDFPAVSSEISAEPERSVFDSAGTRGDDVGTDSESDPGVHLYCARVADSENTAILPPT